VLGTAAIGIGVVTLIAGFLIAHFTGLAEIDSLGREVYPSIPRGWQLELAGQIIALTGVFIVMAGTTLAFLYGREMTWARASIGALLFTGLMIILFGVIPNQWLTLTQAVLEWTPRKIAIRTVGSPGGGIPLFPKWLLLNNEVSISYAALKDIISGTYSVVAIGGVAVVMVKWQDWQKKRAAGPAGPAVSGYGRPLTKAER
jgi:general stress protein CsbA